jgi:recombinational DNA repair protein (RecF pathway)
MRHKYETRGIVLSRTPAGEANAFITLLTADMGVVRARAQGVRRSGAKLSSALATFAENELVLVRGREQWRIAGAVLKENWFFKMHKKMPRERAARISHLLLRLVVGETRDEKLFPIIKNFFEALVELPENFQEAAEILAALRILAALGFDTGEISSDASPFAPGILADIMKNRTSYIARINRGIEASGL